MIPINLRLGVVVAAALACSACGDSPCGATCGPPVTVRFAAPLSTPQYRAELVLDGQRVTFLCGPSGSFTPGTGVLHCGASGFTLGVHPAELRVTVAPDDGSATRSASGRVPYSAPVPVCDFTCDGATFVVP